jgi:hypothetical protein
MVLQNKLIKACEKGSLTDAKAALGEGAIPDQPNEQGKNPLYCAAWGMNPKVVECLIERLAEDAEPISWKKCETHNKTHYGQSFLNMKFAPETFKDLHDLLIKIESNEFLAGFHLGVWRRVCGESDSDKVCGSLVLLMKWISTREIVSRRVREGWTGTERGFVVSKEQIKQCLEQAELQQIAKKTTKGLTGRG